MKDLQFIMFCEIQPLYKEEKKGAMFKSLVALLRDLLKDSSKSNSDLVVAKNQDKFDKICFKFFKE